MRRSEIVENFSFVVIYSSTAIARNFHFNVTRIVQRPVYGAQHSAYPFSQSLRCIPMHCRRVLHQLHLNRQAAFRTIDYNFRRSCASAD